MEKRILYKYYPDSTYFPYERMVRFSSRNSLNDPFEIRPSLEALSLYAKNQLGRELADNELEKILNSDYEGLFKGYGGPSIFNDFGVFCLSETRTNLLMWSHYANSHKGFVVGFDSSHPFFNQNLGPSSDFCGIDVGKVHRVNYDNFRSNNSHEPTNWYLQKSDEWIYEKEHRIILPLNRCDKLIRLGVDGKVLTTMSNSNEIGNTDNLGHEQHICQFEVPADAIASITIGAETSQSLWMGIKNYFTNLPNRHKHFILEKAFVSTNRFKIEIYGG